MIDDSIGDEDEPASPLSQTSPISPMSGVGGPSIVDPSSPLSTNTTTSAATATATAAGAIAAGGVMRSRRNSTLSLPEHTQRKKTTIINGMMKQLSAISTRAHIQFTAVRSLVSFLMAYVEFMCETKLDKIRALALEKCPGLKFEMGYGLHAGWVRITHPYIRTYVHAIPQLLYCNNHIYLFIGSCLSALLCLL